MTKVFNLKNIHAHFNSVKYSDSKIEPFEILLLLLVQTKNIKRLFNLFPLVSQRAFFVKWVEDIYFLSITTKIKQVTISTTNLLQKKLSVYSLFKHILMIVQWYNNNLKKVE